jgi:hypothetical protein
MRAKNIGAAFLLMAFGIWYGYMTNHLPERTLPNTPGPPFFPWILTIGLLILSTAWIINSFRMENGGSIFLEKKEYLLYPAAGLAIFLVFLIFLPKLGFLVGSIPFFAGLMVVSGEKRPLWIAIASIAIPVCLFFLFRYGFEILLPQGEILD